MIAHRRGRIITIAEDARRPIRLVPRHPGHFNHLIAGFQADLADPSGSEIVGAPRMPDRAHALGGGIEVEPF